jgi:hypothetical protein
VEFSASGNSQSVFAIAGRLRRIAAAFIRKLPMPQRSPYVSPTAQARLVVALTTAAWRIAPSSPHEVARRAPHGYVPIRAMRRFHAAAALALLPHSW